MTHPNSSAQRTGLGRIRNRFGCMACDDIPLFGVQVQEALMKNIKRRMTPQPLKIRADVELTCFAYDGVERIRDAMRAAQVGGKPILPEQTLAGCWVLGNGEG